MDWMSPMDASFLHIEGPTNPMHIGGVSIFEGPAPPFERLEDMVGGKLGLVPRYRQKVRFVPLGLGRPAWVDDPHFNLGYHLRHTALPAPGSDDQLLRTLTHRTLNPSEQLRSVRAAVRAPRASLGQARDLLGATTSAARLMRPLGSSSLVGPVGPHRTWSWARVPLAEVKAVRTALGG